MSIEFKCANISYDPNTDKRARCGKKLRAPLDKAGATVTCPACQQPLTIPDAPKSDAAAFRKKDVMDMEFDNGAAATGTANSVAHDRIDRCRKCGRPLDSKGICHKCNYAKPSMKLSKKELDDIKVKPAGCQLWLIKILSEGMPIAVLTSMIHFLFAILTVGGAALIILSTAGLLRVALFAALLAAAFFYVALVVKCYQFLRSPHARLAWFQRPFWNLILWDCRRRQWASNQNRMIIDKRDVAVSDDDLDKIEKLKDVNVLDLEGTQITDDAFRFFYRMDRLQCLVLRDTDVSHENVFRLQQTKPKLWIWY
jgi:hypothetical protein